VGARGCEGAILLTCLSEKETKLSEFIDHTRHMFLKKKFWLPEDFQRNNDKRELRYIGCIECDTKIKCSGAFSTLV
jgi:hypothetical protein